jgi:hypothetical protein
MTTTVQRNYRMTKISAGSYLLPSNDGQTMWHIRSFEDGVSHGLQEPDRTWWACARFPGTYAQAVAAVERDIEDFGYIRYETFHDTDSYLRTRADAIRAALTPAAHWSPDDYYRASRQARAAWEATQPQLVIGLGEDDGPGTTSLVGASSSPNPPSPNADAATPRSSDPSPRGGEGGFETPTTREEP